MKKQVFGIIAGVLLLAALSVACSVEGKKEVNVGALKGPTGLGLSHLMEQSEGGVSKNLYAFCLEGSPDAIVSKIVSKEIDIALVPTNLASVLYNRTEGGVQIIALNTLGVLYILENGNEINSIADLNGKTIYSSGQASVPEYVLNYVLAANGLVPGVDVIVEYKAEHAELATLMAAGEIVLGMLPEPNVTSVMSQNENLRIALNMTEEWDKACELNGVSDSRLVMGCAIVRSEFAAENKDAVDKFLEEYNNSIKYANNNHKDVSVLAEKFGILPSAALAEKALPNCNIVYIDGSEMKPIMSRMLEGLSGFDAKSVGGKLPDESFYYFK